MSKETFLKPVAVAPVTRDWLGMHKRGEWLSANISGPLSHLAFVFGYSKQEIAIAHTLTCIAERRSHADRA